MGKEVLMSQLRWTKPTPIIFCANQASHRPIILSREAFQVFPKQGQSPNHSNKLNLFPSFLSLSQWSNCITMYTPCMCC